MAKEKPIGQKVREALDGPQVEHDALINQIEARAKEQRARTMDAGESGAKVQHFLETTGLNSQAYSWLSSIFKKLDKKDGQHKAMDVITSLETGLPLLKNHVLGQGTDPMDLGEPDAAPVDVVEAPADDAPAADLPADVADDTAGFEDALADLDDNVTPIKKKRG